MPAQITNSTARMPPMMSRILPVELFLGGTFFTGAASSRSSSGSGSATRLAAGLGAAGLTAVLPAATNRSPHLGHFTVRPTASSGTLYEALQFGQVTEIGMAPSPGWRDEWMHFDA